MYGRLFKAPLLAQALTPDGVPAHTTRLLQAAAATALGRCRPLSGAVEDRLRVNGLSDPYVRIDSRFSG
ncbi:hypothetical protein BH09ACT13_BH09ACT13_01950 [soil metagenome]